jgi:hypothetical protein
MCPVGGHRIRAEAGRCSGPGIAVPLSDDAGAYFYFGGPDRYRSSFPFLPSV